MKRIIDEIRSCLVEGKEINENLRKEVEIEIEKNKVGFFQELEELVESKATKVCCRYSNGGRYVTEKVYDHQCKAISGEVVPDSSC